MLDVLHMLGMYGGREGVPTFQHIQHILTRDMRAA